MLEPNQSNQSNFTAIRAHNTENCTIIPDRLIYEQELSIGARILGVLILSFSQSGKVDEITPKALATVMGKSINTTRRYLRELENYGWLRRTQLKDERGKYSGYRYEILEAEIVKKLT